MQNPLCLGEKVRGGFTLLSHYLAYKFWKSTGSAEHFDRDFLRAAKSILDLWVTEQKHENSHYLFERPDDVETDTLTRGGKEPRSDTPA